LAAAVATNECVCRHTQPHSEPWGADPEVFLLIRAALDRLNLRDKPADVVLEGGVLAARDPLLMECTSPLWFSICTCSTHRVWVERLPGLP
jgi:hypothetical protein